MSSLRLRKNISYIPSIIEDKLPISAHNYFMSNPSLSGRGKSIKIKKPKDLVFKNK